MVKFDFHTFSIKIFPIYHLSFGTVAVKSNYSEVYMNKTVLSITDNCDWTCVCNQNSDDRIRSGTVHGETIFSGLAFTRIRLPISNYRDSSKLTTWKLQGSYWISLKNLRGQKGNLALDLETGATRRVLIASSRLIVNPTAIPISRA